MKIKIYRTIFISNAHSELKLFTLFLPCCLVVALRSTPGSGGRPGQTGRFKLNAISELRGEGQPEPTFIAEARVVAVAAG
jgi:hypothetical protein